MKTRFSWPSLLGLLAIALLLLGAWWLPTWGSLRQRAIVEAAYTFSLASISPGSYEWTLQDGQPARGQGLVRTRIQQFERSDIIEMELTPGLSTGDRVSVGQVLARVHSPRNDRRLAEVRALRDALLAGRALLLAGGRPAEVEEARKRLSLAQATREGEAKELLRLRELARDGATSPFDLEMAELQDRIRAIEVEVSKASLEVVRAPARPEAISRIDAEIAAIEARISEIEAIQGEDEVRSPIDGILEIGGSRVVLRVYDLSKVFLRIPIPESDRNRVAVDHPVRFRTPSARDEVFGGRIVDVGQDASTLNGVQVFWLSAEIPNLEGRLCSGMSGVVELDLEGPDRGFFSLLLQHLVQ